MSLIGEGRKRRWYYRRRSRPDSCIHSLSSATAGPLPRARVQAVQPGSLFADRLESYFTTLLALVPLVTITLGSWRRFRFFQGWESTSRIPAREYVARKAGKVVTGYIEQFSGQAGRLTLSALAILASLPS